VTRMAAATFTSAPWQPLRLSASPERVIAELSSLGAAGVRLRA
jgi:hypothetical protein